MAAREIAQAEPHRFRFSAGSVLRDWNHCNDFKYARTDSASDPDMRNCGIGGRGGFPVREMPVIINRMN